jgi:hypothetical protein
MADKCSVCGWTEEPLPITSGMAHFTNRDERTDACLRTLALTVPIGADVRLCRQHAVMLDRALTREYGMADPYVQPLPHNTPTVGVDMYARRAMLTTWMGDAFLPLATLGPEYLLFGRHKARRVTVEFEGRTLSGVWVVDAQDFVRLKVARGATDA